MGVKQFYFYKQPDQMDCGPTCLRMLAKHYGRDISLQKLRKLSETTHKGSSLRTISDAAENIGFRTLGVKISYEKLVQEAPLPCIVHWNQYHFIVVYKIQKDKVFVADPSHGLLKYSKKEFIENWIGSNANENTKEGVALLFETTPRLKQSEIDDIEKKRGFRFLFQYIFRYKKFRTPDLTQN
jgi:ATP-binding cassette subfamily B protein